jgi:hypothetical protein
MPDLGRRQDYSKDMWEELPMLLGCVTMCVWISKRQFHRNTTISSAESHRMNDSLLCPDAPSLTLRTTSLSVANK